MRTVDEHRTRAPADIAFQVAADVEGWPSILPHYRWVRFHQRRGFAEGVVEMSAWRSFPLFRWPTWWVSEMEHDREDRQVRYRHVDGITRGMDVLWEVMDEPGGGSLLRIIHEWEGPRLPLIRGIAANLVIGPVFVSHIAGRTLAGVVEEAERRMQAGGAT